MLVFHTLQLLLALGLWILAARRVRVLAFEAVVDATPILRHIEDRLSAGDEPAALRVAELVLPAWIGVLVRSVLIAEQADRRTTLEERITELDYEARRSLHMIRGIGIAGSRLGILGAIVAVLLDSVSSPTESQGNTAMFSSEAFSSAVLAVAIGAGTFFVGIAASRRLGAVATERLRDVQAAGRMLDSYLERSSGSAPVGAPGRTGDGRPSGHRRAAHDVTAPTMRN